LRGVRWLALIVLALACSGCISTKAEWDPAAYRAAVERQDDDELGRQARAAERGQTLVGLTRKRVHELLGEPLDPSRDAYFEAFPAGWADLIYGRDGEDTLVVQYDRSGRVVRVDYRPG
jgi:hypothetical protein